MRKGKNMKTWFFISIAAVVLLTGACSPLFLVQKEGVDYRGRFLGSTWASEMLCSSGDLLKVLEATHLSTEMKETFYQSHCSADRSYAKVKQIYTSMTSEQRKDIRIALKKNGYSINSGPC
jgi:hypothetical protein